MNNQYFAHKLFGVDYIKIRKDTFIPKVITHQLLHDSSCMHKQ